MNIVDAFMQDIIEHPADDTPRLIYADWLDEHGEPERAEFVRVQCEVARLEALERVPAGLPTAEWKERQKRLIVLSRRVREIVHMYALEWVEDLWPAKNHSWHAIEGGVLSADASAELHFRRGFVAEITCTLADWCGRPCPNAGRDGGTPYHDRYGCTVCHGTGRVDAHGPALVRAAPLERVTLTDRLPYYSPPLANDGKARWVWFASNPYYARSHLGKELFAHLKGGHRRNPYVSEYLSEQEALVALSAACLAWARCVPG